MEGVTSTFSLEPIFDAASQFVDFGVDLLGTIVSNPILVVFIGVSFIGLGLGIVRRLRKTASAN